MNDLDTLNDLDPLALIGDEDYVNRLIAAHRKRREEGAKAAKREAGPKINLVDLGLLPKPESVKIVRRM